MSEGTSGLKSLLFVFVLIFPLHALLYDWTGFWGFIIPVQKEQSGCHVLDSCRRGNKWCFYFTFNTCKQCSAAGTHACTNVTNLKSVALLSALGSGGVVLLWGFREPSGNLEWHTHLLRDCHTIKSSFYSFLTKSPRLSCKELLLTSTTDPCLLV